MFIDQLFCDLIQRSAIFGLLFFMLLYLFDVELFLLLSEGNLFFVIKPFVHILVIEFTQFLTSFVIVLLHRLV
jgi:hypothetical protein